MNDDNNIDQIEELDTFEDVNSLPSVESSIRSKVQKLEDVKEKIKKLNEMLNSYLENDEEYVEAAKAAKTASSKKSSIKQELMAKPGADDIPNKLLEAREEKKELDEDISNLLTEFQKLSGTNQFEDEKGELKQIVYTARLVRRNVFEK